MRAAALKRFSDELFQLNWISISAATATPTVGSDGLGRGGGAEGAHSPCWFTLFHGDHGGWGGGSNLSINLI